MNTFSRLKIQLFLLGLLPLASGCGILYTNVQVPRSYRSATQADVKTDPADKTVTGEACNHSVLFLVSVGKGGYAQAVKNALKDHPGALLYDVQADTKLKSFLGLYVEYCTVVTGKAGQPR